MKKIYPVIVDALWIIASVLVLLNQPWMQEMMDKWATGFFWLAVLQLIGFPVKYLWLYIAKRRAEKFDEDLAQSLVSVIGK